MKIFVFVSMIFVQLTTFAQEKANAVHFWETLQKHCGFAYEGVITAGGAANDGFTGKKLVMHVRSCQGERIRIPFIVGDNQSRTWVLSLKKDGISLKHDHRHEDGTADKVTQYGGISTNAGFPNMQIFPADQETQLLIPAAAGNIWWLTIDNTSFTYNLRRIGTDRLFTVKFDLTKPIEAPPAPWGWKD